MFDLCYELRFLRKFLQNQQLSCLASESTVVRLLAWLAECDSKPSVWDLRSDSRQSVFDPCLICG